jgi:RNA polymerase sigma factor (sigma-70 family)
VAPSGVSSTVSLPPFQTLLDAHGGDVHRFLIAIVGRDDADDCYQEACLAAIRAYPRLTDARNLRGWIFTVAHRKALDRIRARRRAPVAVAALPEPAAPADEIPGARVGGEELWQAVRELPPKQRTAVALRFAADAAYDQISTAMGTSEDAARRNVHEGLKRLRREYTP